MKICIISEGCYPYTVGGVSSWIHSLIKLFPEIDFSLIAVISDRSLRGKFVYILPDNLVSVSEVYLQDFDWAGGNKQEKLSSIRLSEKEYEAIRSLVVGENIQWNNVFHMFSKRNISINELLMGSDFLNIIKEYYTSKYPYVAFVDFLWNMRSIYLPLFLAMKCKPPKADIYHCVATGYAGIIGSMAKTMYPASSLLISEHGVYTREREEEIIKAKWVQGIFKNIWIEQFRKMSRLAYDSADVVTALFEKAHELQIELDCPIEKAVITPNGIDVDAFADIPQKDEYDSYINIGAFLRVTPIKDIKTMIGAFYFAHKKNPKLKLWIMGSDEEDPKYAEECMEFIALLKAENIIFTGRIETTEYIGKMDMTILTSISEGQPLTILESFAAKKPCIATNVGNCYGLIYGESDNYGAAGIVVPVLNINEISEAILELASDESKRKRMGENGFKRLMNKYQIEHMADAYRDIYMDLGLKAGVTYPDNDDSSAKSVEKTLLMYYLGIM